MEPGKNCVDLHGFDSGGSWKDQVTVLDWAWAFTSDSAYVVMHGRGLMCMFQEPLWRLKTPLKVKVFL